MTDNEIKTILNEYVDAEMSLIDMDKYKEYPFLPSDRYKKRMKKMFSVEKYFGKNIRLGYIVRRVAIFVICLVSIAVATEVSARVFGFSPWKYIKSYLSDSKMEQKVYDAPKVEDENYRIKKAKHDLPSYIPEGLEKIEEDMTTKFATYACWSSKDKKKMISFERVKLSKGLVEVSDAEYKKKETCEVGGYVAYYYKKDGENWFDWTDKSYSYTIQLVGYSDAKKELVKIANSIYE